MTKSFKDIDSKSDAIETLRKECPEITTITTDIVSGDTSFWSRQEKVACWFKADKELIIY